MKVQERCSRLACAVRLGRTAYSSGDGELYCSSTCHDASRGFGSAQTAHTTSESQRRKETPVFTGMLRYFPRACRAVARLSFKGDRKHNPDKAPGEPPTWTRNKSADHGDCIVRHQITFDEIDPENGEYHAVAVAWRALAQLEILLEEKGVE